MQRCESHIKAIEYILWHIEQRDSHEDLKLQGLTADEIASIQESINEICGDLIHTKNLWMYQHLTSKNAP